MVDMSQMRSVYVDPAARTAVVDGGCMAKDVDSETAPYGLAAPVGICPTVGVGGLALNGGLSLLSRSYGAVCDNILEAQLVLADGTVVGGAPLHRLCWASVGPLTCLCWVCGPPPPVTLTHTHTHTHPAMSVACRSPVLSGIPLSACLKGGTRLKACLLAHVPACPLACLPAGDRKRGERPGAAVGHPWRG